MNDNTFKMNSKPTCATCRVAFDSDPARNAHFKSDLHRYNLKRKVAGLAPITEEAFSIKERKQAEESKVKKCNTWHLLKS